MLVTILNNCLYSGPKKSYQPATIRTINRQKDIKKEGMSKQKYLKLSSFGKEQYPISEGGR